MLNTITSALPHHKLFLHKLMNLTSGDGRFAGVAISGSASTNQLDQYSDLDVVLAIYPDDFQQVMQQRKMIAAQFGHLLAAFSGEHVGEPRVLICLYGDLEPLHVDLKFVALADVVQKVDNPLVLWENDHCLSALYQQHQGHYPIADLQWFEDRFWVWLHYAASKIARGELFEGLEFVSFLRQNVIAPLAKVANGLEPNGIRKLESVLPDIAIMLESTVACYSAASLFTAVENMVAIYLLLRDRLNTSSVLQLNSEAQTVALNYFNKVRAQGA